MPLYEYLCDRCGETFEKLQKFSDQPVLVHEGCGGNVERLLSVSALQFKGAGWYVNDYGRGSKSNGAAGDVTKTGKKSESKSETKPESKSESKSETKSESKPAAADKKS